MLMVCAFFQFSIFETSLYKLCTGLVFQVGYCAFFRGFSVLLNGRSMTAVLA